MRRTHQNQLRPHTTPRRGGPARLVRAAEVVPRGSTRWILLHLIREARDPAWSPLTAARRLIAHADSDLHLLRATRARLVQAAPPGSAPMSGSYARALATLNIAIADLSDKPENTARGSGLGG